MLDVCNYGSVLQAYATQEIFKSMGCDVDFLNFYREENSSFYRKLIYWLKGKTVLKKFICLFIYVPTFVIQNYVYGAFVKKQINKQKEKIVKHSDFANLKLDSDIYCTGSDQTWNSGWNRGFIPPLFLSFVPNNIRKISYSSSFGKKKLDEYEKPETLSLLKRYSSVSVREQSGVDILENLGIRSVCVLDPTLQVNRDFWQNHTRNIIKVQYALIYQLNTNSEFDTFAKKCAQKTGLKLVRICNRIDEIAKCGKSVLIPEVFDFISLISNASLVITDSFHATAFSINMQVNFISIYPDNYSDRIENILNITGLKLRKLSSYSDFSLLNQSIDYQRVNAILDRERQKGFDYLKSAIFGV